MTLEFVEPTFILGHACATYWAELQRGVCLVLEFGFFKLLRSIFFPLYHHYKTPLKNLFLSLISLSLYLHSHIKTYSRFVIQFLISCIFLISTFCAFPSLSFISDLFFTCYNKTKTTSRPTAYRLQDRIKLRLIFENLSKWNRLEEMYYYNLNTFCHVI